MRVERDPDPQAWDAFVENHPRAHILQTSGWGALKAGFGWTADRVALYDGDAIVAAAQVLTRTLPLGLRLAYVPKGPVVDLDRADLCTPLFTALRRLCRRRRAFALKIEPDLPESPDLAARLAPYGFRPGTHNIQPRRTVHVDLSGSEDEILARMKSKTRYNIRLAARKGVEVHHGVRDDVETFNQLMSVTGERDAFAVHSPAYYRQAYDSLTPGDRACLLIASYEGQALAALLVCACGDKAWYMYGASSDTHRDRMPAYALQWAAMRWARARGCTTYDLWGIPDVDEEALETQFATRSDGLWGVYRHKRGYGGEVVRYAGAFDQVCSRAGYRAYRLGLRVRGAT